MTIKKQVPNTITLLNLFCGCIAMVFASNKEFEMAFYLVSLGIFLDFFDGFFARLFQVSSPLGLQLDSLADMVTSGVVPGMVMYQMMGSASGYPKVDWSVEPFPFLGFLIALGSCYRLANFNIDTRQSDQFIGVPTPANGLLIASLPLILHFQPEFSPYILHFQGLLIYAVVMSYLLVCELPLLAFKFKTWDWKSNQVKFIFLIFCIAALVMLKFAAIPVLVIAYILLSGLIFLLNPNK